MASLYWKWDNVIPKDICNYLLNSLNDKDWEESLVGGLDPILNRDLSYRNNCIQILNTNHWMEGILYNHVMYANKSAGWNYEIDSIAPIQISKYAKEEFYDWHQDCYLLNPRHNELPLVKLSVVLQLNCPTEYTGGGLELEDELCKPLGHNLLLNQGDLIVFPSFINHRALEVKDGTRYSASGWVSGPNFK